MLNTDEMGPLSVNMPLYIYTQNMYIRIFVVIHVYLYVWRLDYKFYNIRPVHGSSSITGDRMILLTWRKCLRARDGEAEGGRQGWRPGCMCSQLNQRLNLSRTSQSSRHEPRQSPMTKNVCLASRLIPGVLPIHRWSPWSP